MECKESVKIKFCFQSDPVTTLDFVLTTTQAGERKLTEGERKTGMPKAGLTLLRGILHATRAVDRQNTPDVTGYSSPTFSRITSPTFSDYAA